ncbi:TIGR02099 family protein [Xylella taiwanensis]|nr:YhdP family protein [Xylella taiwanensis]MCD8463446.1 TIGR02099 family protein [Xylella taiwanensis]MCD8470224.1 TIGR02099 family protein [Xylella taiwanensis]UFS48856.1 TIGR02099 family protein [Xylella taiwanensis]UFS51148.1 TIGR02099 family protein [Xylella taiwanensis]
MSALLSFPRVFRYAAYACVGVFVAVALAVGIFSQLLPLVERHPQQVADWLSARTGQPVRFDALSTCWTQRGPLLRLQGVRIGPQGKVGIGEAEVLVAMYTGLLPGRSLIELRLRGVALTVHRDAAGRWSVYGLPSDVGGDPLDVLRRLGELQVIGGRLSVDAPSFGLSTTLSRINLRVRVVGERLRAGVHGWLDSVRAPVTGVLDFNRVSGDGAAYIEALPTELASWSPLLTGVMGGISIRDGDGHVQVWTQLHRHQVERVTVQAHLQRIRFEGMHLAGQTMVPSVFWPQLQALARWQRQGDGWRIVVPRLRMGESKRLQRLDGLVIEGGSFYTLSAPGVLDAGTVLAVLALGDWLAPDLRTWLQRARPQLSVAGLHVRSQADGRLWVAGRFDRLGFLPVDNAPGLSGVRGTLEADAQGGVLTPDPSASVRLDWPSGFGGSHEIHLTGRIVGWRQGDGWKVATPALRVQAADYGADVRGGLWFEGHGTLPRISMAMQLDDVAVPVAKRFWVRSKMSHELIGWLNSALVDGLASGGFAIIEGELQDWPFKNHNGYFEAAGRIHNGVMRFQREWPALEKLDADVAFTSTGFSLHGRSELAGVPAIQCEAGIEDFERGDLYVRARVQSDATQLLGLLRRSPLHRHYADTLDNVSAAGPANVSFDMQLPLRHKENADYGHLGGEVMLGNVRFTERRWNLTFENVRGPVRYSSSGFSTEGLHVLHQGLEGRLSLRAGDAVDDPAQVFQARLSAAVNVKSLLHHAPQMDWLRPYVYGTSQWRIGLDLAKSVAEAHKVAGHLTLDSDLVGTGFNLPAPLDKGSGRLLPTHVDVALPMEQGDIALTLDKLAAARVRNRGSGIGVRVVMGGDSVREAPPEHGLVLIGRSASLDAIDWIRLVRGGSAASSDLPLRLIDLQIDRLLLLGGVFPNTRLQLRPVHQAVAVTVNGSALSGQLNIPESNDGTVTGTLGVLHWQAAQAPWMKGPGAVQRPMADVDPASIPSLAFEVDDVKFGQTKFGRMELRTRRLPEAMQLDQLQMNSPNQRLSMVGTWRGKGEAASTRLSLRVDSRDLGELAQTIGYGAQLRGGEGGIELNAGWNGSPIGFHLPSLSGDLKVAARNGQLLELKPGAGRVLGLLSVTQLPRRLMLDFRDFFSKGLAFNRLDGEVHFGDGQARTDGLKIEGPAVNIAIRGQADLAAQTFDQIVDVNPKSGNLLTVVGAVAGGPVGAAVGAAANMVLSKPLGAIGAKTYHVSGPWNDPKVEVLNRESRQHDKPSVSK